MNVQRLDFRHGIGQAAASILKSQKIPFGLENFINSTVNAIQLMLTYQNKLPSLRFSSL